MLKLKPKKAQQIVEFLLAAPFIIIFLAIFTEYAYALNINLTLTKSLKTACVNIYREIKPNMTRDEITEKVKERFLKDLENNSIPTESENNISLDFFTNAGVGIFMAKYTYYPAFSLPTIFFKFMPEKFEFRTTAPVPVSLLKENNYASAVNSTSLDEIWAASSFSDLNSFDGAKNGILKDTTGRDKILFLVPTNIFEPDLKNTYMLVNWDGNFISDTSDSSKYMVYSKNNTDLYSCSIDNNTCTQSSNIVFNYLKDNELYYIYVVDDSAVPVSNIANLPSLWNQNNDADLSLNSAQGILKRTISITDKEVNSTGNYDSESTIYPFGSMIFVDKSAEIRNHITSTHTRLIFSGFGG